MPWTYAEVKAADAALSPAEPDPAAAAAALNARTSTLTLPAAAVSVASVHGILLLAATGDWLRIGALAAQNLSSGFPASPAATDAPIAAAKLAVELAASKVDAIDPADWAGFLGQLQVLQTAGAVSQASYANVTALAPLTAAAWEPPLTAGDVQTARAQPS